MQWLNWISGEHIQLFPFFTKFMITLDLEEERRVEDQGDTDARRLFKEWGCKFRILVSIRWCSGRNIRILSRQNLSFF